MALLLFAIVLSIRWVTGGPADAIALGHRLVSDLVRDAELWRARTGTPG